MISVHEQQKYNVKLWRHTDRSIIYLFSKHSKLLKAFQGRTPRLNETVLEHFSTFLPVKFHF